MRNENMLNDSLGFLDLISIMSFVVGIVNYEENLTQSDKQDLQNALNEKIDLILNEIHGHLEIQDNKLAEILARLDNGIA